MRHHTRRHGLTLLESVLAGSVLALVVAGVTGATSFMVADQRRDELRLAAMELAHRIVLQHLDDAQAMSSQKGLPIDYAGVRFRWDLQEQDLEVDTEGVDVDRDAARSAFKRFKRVSVRVWLSEESGGATLPITGVPRASLARVYDVLPFRNLDSFGTMINTNRGLQDMLEALTESSQ